MANNFVLTLPTLTVQIGTGMYAAQMQILRPTVSASITQGAHFTMVAAPLPWPPTVTASFQGLTAALTLPALAAGTIHAVVPAVLRATVVLPGLASAGISATVTGRLTAAVSFPQLTVDMRRGSDLGQLSLPSMTGSAHIAPNLRAGFVLTLPPLRASAISIHAPLNVVQVDIILPAMVGLSGSTNAEIRLPALHGSAIIVAGTQAVRQGWAMNIRNNLVTKFTGYEFRAFARAFDKYYGVGLDSGFYRLDGDSDAGAPIAWDWSTGLSDLGSRALKGVLALYVDGIAEPGCTFNVITERGTFVYTHQPHGTINDHETQRVPIGKNLRSVNLGFGMASAKGAYFEIDSITPDYQISDRNL